MLDFETVGVLVVFECHEASIFINPKTRPPNKLNRELNQNQKHYENKGNDNVHLQAVVVGVVPFGGDVAVVFLTSIHSQNLNRPKRPNNLEKCFKNRYVPQILQVSVEIIFSVSFLLSLCLTTDVRMSSRIRTPTHQDFIAS